MKFREIFRFELAYQFGRASTWLFFAIIFLFGAGIVRAGSSDTPVNAPSIVALFTVFAGAIWLIIGGAVAGDAAARDPETSMDPLLYSTPLHKVDYLGGRFLAVLLINALILLSAPVGMLLSTLLPGIPADARGPFRIVGYLTAYGYIALPNLFVITVVQFVAALRSRRANRAYLGSLFILIVSHLLSSVLGTIFDDNDLTKMMDLVGLIGIVGSELEMWSPIDMKTRLISLEGVYLANRLIWFGVGMVALVVTYTRFRFAHAGARKSWFGRRRNTAELKVPAVSGLAERNQTLKRSSRGGHARAFGFGSYLRQIATITWTSFRVIAFSRTGLIGVVIGGAITALFMPEFMQFMGVPMLPRTDRVIQMLTAPLGDVRSPWIVIPLLTVFYAGELVWRERDAGISEMAAAAPVPESALFLGKFLGLGLVLASWMAIMMGAGMLGQLQMGFREFEFSRYLQTLLGLQLADYLLFALLALVIQVVVNNKYVGHLAAVVAYGLILFPAQLGIRHHLLIYASDPGWNYSTFRGYGASLAPWAWFKLYWTAWAILLAVGARVMWVRSRELGLRERLSLARSRITRSTVSVAALAAALLFSTGAFTFYNTNVLNTYLSPKGRAEQSVRYEKQYGKYERVVQPRLTSAKFTVDIFTSRREANVQGHYQLVNHSTVAIDTIHVATMPAVTTGEIRFDRPAKSVLIDDELGHRIYALTTPLEAGDSMKLDFEVNFVPHGFSNSGYDDAVALNGTRFKNQDWFPDIGYQPQRGLTGDSERRKHGLVPRPRIPSLYDNNAPRDRSDAEQVAVETAISTDAGQTAIAPGMLTRSWSDGDRRYFHYVTDAPIGNEYGFFSANYGIEKSQWNGVAIEVYYHPLQKEIVERMVKGVQSALAYYTSKFGPYPYRLVRFVARPGAGVGMHADASTIDYSEGAAAVNPNPRGRALDLTSFVVAHEVSHQWWGTQVSPAYVEGAGLLGEGLANYSALKVTENSLGADQVRRLLSMWRQMYEEPRSRASTPLLQAADQFASYRKGPFAVYTLSQYIGADPVNLALRRLVEKYGSGKPPLPTSLELYAELKAVTPDTLHRLLHDLFEKNTFWDMTAEQASMRESAPGKWEVTLNIKSKKTIVDEQGVVTEVPMNDWVEIGVSASDTTGSSAPTMLYLEKHLVKSGEQTIVVTVSNRPDRAGVDPRYLLLGRAMENNVKSVVPKKPGI